MRGMLGRGTVFGALVFACAAVAGAQPPTALPPIPVPEPTPPLMPPPAVAPDKLRAGVAALAADRTAAETASRERAELKARLDQLLDQAKKPIVRPGPLDPVVPPPVVKGKDGGGPSVDPLRAATDLVRANNTDAALKAFQQIDLQTLAPDDRAFARYMTASCLRKLGRPDKALSYYREVVDAGDDPFLVSSAQSQVTALRMSEELEAQLAQLRARPKNR